MLDTLMSREQLIEDIDSIVDEYFQSLIKEREWLYENAEFTGGYLYHNAYYTGV